MSRYKFQCPNNECIANFRSIISPLILELKKQLMLILSTGNIPQTMFMCMISNSSYSITHKKKWLTEYLVFLKNEPKISGSVHCRFATCRNNKYGVITRTPSFVSLSFLIVIQQSKKPTYAAKTPELPRTMQVKLLLGIQRSKNSWRCITLQHP